MSIRFSELLLVGASALLVACHSTPQAPQEDEMRPVAMSRSASQSTPKSMNNAEATASLPVEVDKKSQKLFTDALAAIDAKRYADAAALLGELTRREPNLSSAWFNLGMVESALGDESAAESSLKKAVETNPNNCAAYTELGLLRRRAGDFAGAEANYLACVARVPDFREAHLNLGILYELYLGRLPEALDAYRTYLALLDGEDRRVAGWVKDLERRLAVVSQS